MLFELLPEDDDLILDTLIERAQSILSDLFDEIHSIALKSLIDNIRKDHRQDFINIQSEDHSIAIAQIIIAWH